MLKLVCLRKKYIYCLGGLVLATSLVSACSSSNESSDPACQSENLLQDPGFETNGQQESDWLGRQHIGEESFITEVEDGVLTIKKIATQPWFAYTQSFNDLAPYAEKEMVFSADLKLDLNTEDLGHAFKAGGGMTVKVLGEPDFLSGDKVLYVSKMEHEPRLGQTEWMDVSVKFTMPEDAIQLVVGFLHQANGEMAVRNPYLGVCE